MPRPGLRGMAGQTNVVGRRGMGSKTCMSPTVGHRQRTGALNQRKAVHRRVQAGHRQHPGACKQGKDSAQAAQGQRAGSVKAAYRQCVLDTQTLDNDGTWLGLRWGALKNPLGRA